MCTGVVQWAGTCPVGDVVPHTRQLCWSVCRDLVAPSALTRLTVQPSYVVCPPVTSERRRDSVTSSRLARLVGHLNRTTLSSSCLFSLSLFSLSRLKRSTAACPLAFLRPPFILKAGPPPLRRLLITLNHVDFVLTSFID
jgi:hypothetical protein